MNRRRVNTHGFRGRSAGSPPPLVRGAPRGLAGAIVVLFQTGVALADTPGFVELRGAESVQAIEFLRDGKHLAVSGEFRAINLWELLHHYWPEELGALLGIALVVLLGAGLRVWARPQRAGEPHCGKCGYCCSGLAEHPCPECGSRPRRTGRTPWRRLRWPFIAVTLLGTLYVGLFAAGVGRWSRAYDTFEWWSFGLVDFAREHDQAWLLSRCESIGQRRIIPRPPVNECTPVSPEEVFARSAPRAPGRDEVTSEPGLGLRMASAPGRATGSGDAVVSVRGDDRTDCTLALRGIPYDDPVHALAIEPETLVFAVAVEDLNPGGDRGRRWRVALFRLPRGTTGLNGSSEPR